MEGPKTLYQKIFEQHVVAERGDGTVLLYIDRHLIHEVTSAQAFSGLETQKRSVRRPDLTLATADHNVSTTARPRDSTAKTLLKDPVALLQVETLEKNVRTHRIPYIGLSSRQQGIVHIIGPELGFTLPGTTIVCGDSHTSTHGAFGALAFGIGTSEVEHVLSTQTVIGMRWQNMRIYVNNALAEDVGSKDLMLYIIGQIGTAGGTGMAIEFAGPTIENMSMDSRMALCNMSVEAGARAGLIAPDDTTIKYIKGRMMAPEPDSDEWDNALKHWKALKTDRGAAFDREVSIDAGNVVPTVTWGTSPEQVMPVTGCVPHPDDFVDKVKQESCRRALEYMGIEPGTKMTDITVDKVFIGSCTNARLEDIQSAARVLHGRRISPHLKLALMVPGSGVIKKQAEDLGLDIIFKKAGFQWREAGCSLCVGLNEDSLSPFERCASTSNRNFESRQGTAGRTHLMSPAMAAAAAIEGKIADVRLYSQQDLNGTVELNCSDATDETSSGEEESEDVNPVLDEAPTKLVRESPKVISSKRFESVEGIVAPMDRSNIDTDCIFPKQFCTTISRTGLRNALFYNLRWNSDGTFNKSFILNREPYTGARILLSVGPNFGCGSSREHAVWALHDFGIRCVLAPSFADIFYNNAFKNGVLPAVIDSDGIERVKSEAFAGRSIKVDLVSQTVLTTDGFEVAGFAIDVHRKRELLEGIDEIESTLLLKQLIDRFEDERRKNERWLDSCASSGWKRFSQKGKNRKLRTSATETAGLKGLKW